MNLETSATKTKIDWIVEWCLTVNGKIENHKKVYKSFDEAKVEVRKLIASSCSDVKHINRMFSYLLESEDNPKLRKAIVGFILRYLTQEDFRLNEPIEKLSDALDRVDIYPDTTISNNIILFFDNYNEQIINTDMIIMEDEKEEYSFELTPGITGGLEFLKINLKPRKYLYDKAAYPLLVLKTLMDSTEHLSQKDISLKLITKFNFNGERKAIGRHINLLKELDFGIKHDKQGYYVENKKIITEEEFSIIKNALELYSGIDEERKAEILSKLSD